MNLFSEDYKINKPLRMIELFAGYGSQSLAMKRAGIPFESWFVCEFDKYAIESFNAVHGTKYKPTDIREVHADDLNIQDYDNYCYMMTYSFPCTDISIAGQMKGFSKADWENGNATRSGLLWEVGRLVQELQEREIATHSFS